MNSLNDDELMEIYEILKKFIRSLENRKEEVNHEE